MDHCFEKVMMKRYFLFWREVFSKILCSIKMKNMNVHWFFKDYWFIKRKLKQNGWTEISFLFSFHFLLVPFLLVFNFNVALNCRAYMVSIEFRLRQSYIRIGGALGRLREFTHLQGMFVEKSCKNLLSGTSFKV